MPLNVNVGSKRRKDTVRAPRSNTLPPTEPIPTDPAVANLASLVDVQFKPLFSEVYQRGRGDYAAFASDFLDVGLHEGQVRWLHTAPWTPERHLSSGNRWGKSHVGGVKLLHDAFYQTRLPKYAELTKEYIALNLSLTIDMSRIVYDYAVNMGLSSKLFRRFIVEDELKTAPFPILVIGTGKRKRDGFRSEIWARSSAKDAKYILGKHFDFINYDEAARDPHGMKILDEVLRMRLADRDGRLDMTSTAAGKNWFYLEFMRGINDLKNGYLNYYSQTGPTYENPHVSHDRVKLNEGIMARAWVEQNIYGGFAEYANVFERTLIESCYTGVDYPLLRDFNLLDTYLLNPEFGYSEDKHYIVGIDWALKRDETVILIADIDTFPARIVYAQGFAIKPTGGRWEWDELKKITVMLHRRFNNAYVLYDSTGLAGSIIDADLSGMGMVGQEGYNFSGNQGQAKDALILVTQQALQNRVVQFPFIPELYDQLTLYDRDDKNLPTDWVFSFALLMEAYRRKKMPEGSTLADIPNLFANLRYRYGQERALSSQSFELTTPTRAPHHGRLGEGMVLSSTGYRRATPEEITELANGSQA